MSAMRPGILVCQGLLGLASRGWANVTSGERPLLFCRLSKLDAVVFATAADVDQCVSILTTGTQEVAAIGVEFRRDSSKHDFEAAFSAFPHRVSSNFVPQSYCVRPITQ